MFNDRQDEEVKFRSTLGRWRHANGAWVLFKVRESAPPDDSRKYTVEHCKRSYAVVQTYHTDKLTLSSTMVNYRGCGYVQTEYTYPELQKYFRNGKRVTLVDSIVDALPTVPYQTDRDVEREMLESLF